MIPAARRGIVVLATMWEFALELHGRVIGSVASCVRPMALPEVPCHASHRLRAPPRSAWWAR